MIVQNKLLVVMDIVHRNLLVEVDMTDKNCALLIGIYLDLDLNSFLSLKIEYAEPNRHILGIKIKILKKQNSIIFTYSKCKITKKICF